MSTAEFKEVLGFRQANTQRVYESLRGEIKIYMGVHGISNRTQAGDTDWRALIDWVLKHEYIRRVRNLHRGAGIHGGQKLRRAAHFLCLSCTRSIHVSPRLLDQVLEESSDEEAIPVTPVPEKASTRTIRVELFDPDRRHRQDSADVPYLGHGILVRYYTTLAGEPRYSSYSRLIVACQKHLPYGRKLSELRGWTGSPVEDVILSDSEEVSAWLSATTNDQPLRVLAILRRVSSPRPVVVSTQLVASPSSTSRD